MDFTSRYVALGDSFTEGVGDDDPDRPNGVRGWADRVAEQLGAADPSFGYANLAIRGRKLRQIMAEQVDAAVELKPTLVTIYAGANDILRPRIDIDGLLAEYDAGIRKLKATGATVVMFTGFDARGSKVFGTMRGRTAIYNELVRGIAGTTARCWWTTGVSASTTTGACGPRTGCTCPPPATRTWPRGS